MICKNYTGDRLHFGLAMEKARASGQEVEMLVVDDDVSIDPTDHSRVGRRGLAGTVFVHKILGACAAEGMSLVELVRIGKEVIDNLATIGMSLSHASVPSSSNDALRLAHDEVEIGMGIHNEPGVKKVKLAPISDLVSQILPQLCRGKDPAHSFAAKDEIALMINNLGGISNIELHHFAQIVAKQLEDNHGLIIHRTYIGAFMTSLDGAGLSITLMKIPPRFTSMFLEWLDKDTDALGWRACSSWSTPLSEIEIELEKRQASVSRHKMDPSVARGKLERACHALIKAEPEITKLDTVTGDGDAGTTLKVAAQAILNAAAADRLVFDDAAVLFDGLADELEDHMGGTSGALYTVFLTALHTELSGREDSGIDVFASALNTAHDRLMTYTSARVGDKTLMDTLTPFVKVFTQTQNLDKAVEAAKIGMESTKSLKATMGRASYTPESSTLDAGAVGVFTILNAL